MNKANVTIAVLALSMAFSGAVQAQARYLAASWGDDEIKKLDAGMNVIGSFGTQGGLPNGVGVNAANGEVFVGNFINANVEVYDMAGTLLRTVATGTSGLQGLDHAGNGKLAIFDAASSTVGLYDDVTGALDSVVASSLPSTYEALSVEGNGAWLLGDTIDYLDFGSGLITASITNAASNESFGGTALAIASATTLMIGAGSGNWYEVLKADGSVVNFGNNGVQMYGMEAVPEPGTMAALGLGLAALARKRRK